MENAIRLLYDETNDKTSRCRQSSMNELRSAVAHVNIVNSARALFELVSPPSSLSRSIREVYIYNASDLAELVVNNVTFNLSVSKCVNLKFVDCKFDTGCEHVYVHACPRVESLRLANVTRSLIVRECASLVDVDVSSSSSIDSVSFDECTRLQHVACRVSHLHEICVRNCKRLDKIEYVTCDRTFSDLDDSDHSVFVQNDELKI